MVSFSICKNKPKLREVYTQRSRIRIRRARVTHLPQLGRLPDAAGVSGTFGAGPHCLRPPRGGGVQGPAEGGPQSTPHLPFPYHLSLTFQLRNCSDFCHLLSGKKEEVYHLSFRPPCGTDGGLPSGQSQEMGDSPPAAFLLSSDSPPESACFLLFPVSSCTCLIYGVQSL